MLSLLSSLSIKPCDKMEQLMENLMNYSNKGLPQLPALILLGRPIYEPTQFNLESHWTAIVANQEKLGQYEKQHQEAIWELISTELNYIARLKVVVDLFVSCLFNLQNDLLLNEIEVDKCFGRIVDVYFSQCKFWTQTSLPCLNSSRESRSLLSISQFRGAFQQFEETFDPCVRFCLEQQNLVHYFKNILKNNETFRYFIAWAESQSQCNRLAFLDLIAEPLMRLTKYQLLFSAIKKPLNKMTVLDNVDQSFVSEEIEAIEILIEKVVHLTTMTNSLLMKRQDFTQLSCLINRIDSYEVADNNEEVYSLLNQYTDLDLTQAIPGCARNELRVVLHEANVKLKDSILGKIDAVCILLTDMILIARSWTRKCDRLKIIRPPIRIDHVVVHELKDGQSFLLIQLTECGLLQAYYLLFGETKTWIKKIEKARETYAEKRHQYREQRCAIEDDAVSRESFKSLTGSSFKSHTGTSVKAADRKEQSVNYKCEAIGQQSEKQSGDEPFGLYSFFPWQNWDDECVPSYVGSPAYVSTPASASKAVLDRDDVSKGNDTKYPAYFGTVSYATKTAVDRDNVAKGNENKYPAYATASANFGSLAASSNAVDRNTAAKENENTYPAYVTAIASSSSLASSSNSVDRDGVAKGNENKYPAYVTTRADSSSVGGNFPKKNELDPASAERTISYVVDATDEEDKPNNIVSIDELIDHYLEHDSVLDMSALLSAVGRNYDDGFGVNGRRKRLSERGDNGGSNSRCGSGNNNLTVITNLKKLVRTSLQLNI